jgi:3-phosphoshikimate 1-carboxyvinyltransferase
MGALVFCEPGYKAPLVFRPPENGYLLGGRYELPVASAQVKSALLLAGLYSKNPITVKEPAVSRDHTERMLKDFGIRLNYNLDGSISLPVNQKLRGCKINVPGDLSSAAFILAAAALCPGSCVTVKNVGLNPTRAGFLDVLKDMGADISIEQQAGGAEPVGNITLRYKPLKATDIIKGEIIPRLIDELPVIAVLAAAAAGVTLIKDAGELRVKESDRIKLVVGLLRDFGVEAEETEDGMRITGKPDSFTAPTVESMDFAP